MGDNCVPFLMRIAEKRDVNIFLEHYMEIPKVYFEKEMIYRDGVVLTEDEYDDGFSDWCEYMDNKYDDED